MEKQRLYKMIYFLCTALFILSGIGLGIFSFLSDQKKSSLFLGCAVILYLLFPFLLKKKGIALPYQLWVFLLFYLFLAYHLGFVLDGYRNWTHFDKFVHFLSGFVNFLLGLMMFIYLNRKGKAAWSSAILFSLFFSLFIASVFELIECAVFLTTGYDTQNTMSTGVFDTMGDLTVALISSILMAIYYYRRGKQLRLNKTVIEKFCQLNGYHSGAEG